MVARCQGPQTDLVMHKQCGSDGSAQDGRTEHRPDSCARPVPGPAAAIAGGNGHRGDNHCDKPRNSVVLRRRSNSRDAQPGSSRERKRQFAIAPSRHKEAGTHDSHVRPAALGGDEACGIQTHGHADKGWRTTTPERDAGGRRQRPTRPRRRTSATRKGARVPAPAEPAESSVRPARQSPPVRPPRPDTPWPGLPTLARARSNGRTAAKAAAKAMMLAPRGRKSAPGPAVAVRMNHHSARRPRLLNTRMSRRSGGAVISAATSRTAARIAMAADSACQKPPSRQPATAASTKTKPGTIHPFGAPRARPVVRRAMESCSPSAVMGFLRLAGAQETVAPSVGPSSSVESCPARHACRPSNNRSGSQRAARRERHDERVWLPRGGAGSLWERSVRPLWSSWRRSWAPTCTSTSLRARPPPSSNCPSRRGRRPQAPHREPPRRRRRSMAAGTSARVRWRATGSRRF